MKKIGVILCILGLSVGITACNANNTTKDNDQQNETAGQSLDMKEQSIVEVKNDIGADSAKLLILEQLDQNIYSVELKSSDVVIGGEGYYAFTVFKQDKALDDGIAVNKSSGEIYSYDFAGNISALSESEFYNKQVKQNGDFSGTFQNESGSIQFEPADETSSEFTIDIKSDDGNGSVSGVVRINGNQAVYQDEKGFTITFFMNNGNITVTESGTNTYGVDFAGEYSFTED